MENSEYCQIPTFQKEEIDGINKILIDEDLHFDELNYEDLNKSSQNNVSSRSIVLAPFNSIMESEDEEIEILEVTPIKYLPNVLDYDE